MISGQCDKLRETADKIQRIKYDNADWLWCDAITLADAVGQMRDAADLILELRDNLLCANEAVKDAEHDESMAWDRVRKAEAENAKLRERIEELESCAVAPPLEEQLLSALDENAKLREELAKARDPQRMGGQADPSSFVYAIEQLREFRWQHATNDEDAIPYINNVAAAHERENAGLREACAELLEMAESHDPEWLHWPEMYEELRKLGVKV